MAASPSTISRLPPRRSATARLRFDRPSRKMALCAASDAILVSLEADHVETVGEALAERADQMPLRGDIICCAQILHCDRLGNTLPHIAREIDADDHARRQCDDDVTEAQCEQRRKVLRCKKELFVDRMRSAKG